LVIFGWFSGPWFGLVSGVAVVRVIVAGAGIGGLSAALSLHAAGIEAIVIDSAAALRPLGVGINLMPHAVRELTELGLGGELEATGIPTAEMVHFDRHGNRIWGFASGRNIGYHWPQYSIHRGELQMILLAAVRNRLGPWAVRTGTAFVSFAESSAGVTVRVRDRSSGTLRELRGDALVGADGLNSRVRAQLHPGEPPPRWGGVMMWRGVMEGAPFLTGRTVAVAGTNAALKFVAYPISRQAERRGRALLNWVAEVKLPGRAALASLDRNGADWNREGRLGDVLPWFADWEFGWLDVPALITGAPRILEYPMVDRDPLPSWGSEPSWGAGRVTLLGDAAHPMYPIGANGGSQAVLDARVLAWSLARADTPAEGLAAYESQRLPVVNAIVLACRDMPADRLLQTVSTRAPGGFERIEDVLSAAELAAFDEAYRATTLPDVAALNSRPSLTPLPAVGRGVRVAADGLGVLGRLVHRLHRDPARAPQPDPDAAVAPRAAPEGEAHVPRVLHVQRHPHRDVPVEQ
jgi:2-polyprenyl-6-methoxyphenol hydroxylase-like FAD-dependent oxidoreductase